MDITHCTQAFCGLFRRQITLGFRQHLVADHKFTYGRGAQQRRIKVGVQLPVLILFAIKGRAVPAHGIRERALEQVVITAGQLFQRQRQIAALGSLKSVIRRTWAFGSSRVSNGHAAQYGTTANQCSVSTTVRLPSASSRWT